MENNNLTNNILVSNLVDDLNPKTLAKNLSKRVRARRLELNLTQAGLAKRSGVSLGSIQRFENQAEISLKSLLKIAVALKAEKFVQLTNVPGVLRKLDDPTSLIKRIARTAIPSLIATGIISSGMIPKIKCCEEALQGGVPRTHIIDGRVPHSLLIEMFSDRGVGTMIL